jgi:hypothetical protein
MNIPNPPLEAWSALFVFAAIVLAIAMLFALSGCALPIPPSGPDMGKYGTVYLTPRYEPNALTAPYINLNTNSFK